MASDDKEPKVGSILRIRLPNDYVVSHGPALDMKPENQLTLDQYNDRILSDAARRFAECQAHQLLFQSNALLDAIYYSDGVIPKRSWRRRRLDAARDFGYRVRDAWSVLTGRASIGSDD